MSIYNLEEEKRDPQAPGHLYEFLIIHPRYSDPSLGLSKCAQVIASLAERRAEDSAGGLSYVTEQDIQDHFEFTKKEIKEGYLQLKEKGLIFETKGYISF